MRPVTILGLAFGLAVACQRPASPPTAPEGMIREKESGGSSRGDFGPSP